MPRFTFKLQRVLDLRRRTEDDLRRRVAAIEAERVAAEDRLRAVQRAIEAGRAEQRTMLAGASAGPRGLPGRLDAAALRTQTSAVMSSLAQAHRLALELTGILKRLESARAELLKASAERKAVELLRERQYEEWKREQGRREIALLDEIGASRYVRAASESESP